MATFTFNETQEKELAKQGFQFITAQSTGKLFQRFRDGHVEGRLLRPDGSVGKYLPYVPTSTFERQRWGV